MSASRIRPIAVVVIRRGNEILVSMIPDEVRGVTGWRPLGGTIEFGERGEETVVRELREEIGNGIVDTRYVATLENIFSYRGVPAHEIIRVYEARFADGSLYERDRFDATEERSAPFVCVWRDLSSFGPDAPLYPDGLLELLR